MFTGETGVDSVSLAVCSVGGGVEALDNEGEEGAETPSESSCFLCSDFCFFSNLSASISARLCSRASKFPFLVEAPAGKAENQDMNFSLQSVVQ